jgi:hypothetical protein
MEESGLGLFEMLSQYLAGGTQKNHDKPVRIARVPVKISTEHPPNMITDHYCYANPHSQGLYEITFNNSLISPLQLTKCKRMRYCQHIPAAASTYYQSSCLKLHALAPSKLCHEFKLYLNRDIFMIIMPIYKIMMEQI